MQVPEAPVDEDRLPPRPKDDVGTARQILRPDAVSVAESVERPPERQLRSGVPAPDAPHVLRAADRHVRTPKGASGGSGNRSRFHSLSGGPTRPRPAPPRTLRGEDHEGQHAQATYLSERPFALRKSSTLLNAFKKSGLPAKESGLTGPIVMNEYCRLCTSKAEWGSRNSL